MEPLLGAKIGCLLALLLLTLGCGLIPICFKWFHTDAATGRHRRALSLLGCASAGVFLGAGLMHMTAEALEGIESEIQGLMMQNRTERVGNASEDSDSARDSCCCCPSLLLASFPWPSFRPICCIHLEVSEQRG
ncbi:zinc transporter ZIP2 isoform X2 [Vulpes lagopus]|uniref:zinc transporter ZIP2 isoform X2 n=1 Tax=Vulpes lagopus TaxID=494514 RepID=UPI001BCA62AE|nr:zinc transporter ZIP2 isoform X2 [Vulpes lagopus]